MDKRKDNNPHRTAEAKGALDAENRRPLSECPYKAPQFRNSWLRGYQKAQQLDFFEGNNG
ncbi:ribosome modulation factor [Pseudomonas antarctica]|uniref:ribosome modulation factor n=1 Tax=Pseudomonas antarctica TaxID=219572 RepID=UPI0009EEEBDC|nr:CrpP family ICE-associated protein [Pseudomonas antarctica]